MRTLLAVTLLAACATTPATPAPGETPPLEVVADRSVQTTMTRMARRIRGMEQVLMKPSGAPLTPDERTLALTLLEQVETESKALNREEVALSHPEFALQLDQFHADLDLARIALGATPPDPRAAVRIAAACSTCHKTRR